MKLPGKKTLALALSIAACASVQAETDPVSIPVEGPLEMRKTESGTTVLISSDGRFVMPARLIDRTKGNKLIESLDDARAAYGEGSNSGGGDKVSLEGYDPDDLLSFTVGNGDQDVYVWFDPTCPHCATVLEMEPELGDRYTFHNVLYPALGPRAERLTEQMACLSEDEMREAAVAKKQSIQVDDESNCQDEKLSNNIQLARANGIRSVPVIITSDGRSQTGAFRSIAGMKAFLKGDGQ